MDVKHRLKRYIQSENISISEFERSIDVSNGYVNSISKSIGLDKLSYIIEKYPKLNIEWLLTGQGDMLKAPNNTSGAISESITQYGKGKISRVNSHNVNINGDLEGKKIIRPDQIEIKQESNADSIYLQEINRLKDEIEGLKSILNTKDALITEKERTIDTLNRMIALLSNK